MFPFEILCGGMGTRLAEQDGGPDEAMVENRGADALHIEALRRTVPGVYWPWVQGRVYHEVIPANFTP